jgi:hypothetical protein
VFWQDRPSTSVTEEVPLRCWDRSLRGSCGRAIGYPNSFFTLAGKVGATAESFLRGGGAPGARAVLKLDTSCMSRRFAGDHRPSVPALAEALAGVEVV